MSPVLAGSFHSLAAHRRRGRYRNGSALSSDNYFSLSATIRIPGWPGQRRNARLVVKGLLGDLERKRCEPIARRVCMERKPVQFFVGASKWDDASVRTELRRHVTAERADPHGVLIFDGSGFPKKGKASCGVKTPVVRSDGQGR